MQFYFFMVKVNSFYYNILYIFFQNMQNDLTLHHRENIALLSTYYTTHKYLLWTYPHVIYVLGDFGNKQEDKEVGIISVAPWVGLFWRTRLYRTSAHR
jgi:hypothetical protein